MRKARFVILLCVSLLAVVLTAGTASAITESGYLNGTGSSYSFTVNAGSDTFVEVVFSYPKGSADFWVEVIGEDGYTVLGNFDLDNGEIIQLSGGSTFYLTIYSNYGAGYWSAEYYIDGGGGGGGSGGGSGGCNTSGNSAWGSLYGPGDACTWSIYSSVNTLNVTFSYPKGSVDYWVEVVGQDGYTVLGNFDLDNGEIIQLMGGGTFYLTIYSNRGSGNWSAGW